MLHNVNDFFYRITEGSTKNNNILYNVNDIFYRIKTLSCQKYSKISEYNIYKYTQDTSWKLQTQTWVNLTKLIVFRFYLQSTL